MSYLRCPYDNKTLLNHIEDDVVLEDCEHYHWHLEANDSDIADTIKTESEEDNEDDEEDEEDWKEILKANHIAAVSVEGGKFYLLPVEKAVKEA